MLDLRLFRLSASRVRRAGTESECRPYRYRRGPALPLITVPRLRRIPAGELPSKH
jgi:hypothetical protein